jgi:acetoin utilization deacetylase AcuC-like enzyme
MNTSDRSSTRSILPWKETEVNTAIYYSPTFLEHDPGPDHPEVPQRLKAITSELARSGLLRSGKCSYIQPRPAKGEDLRLVHEIDYIELVKKASASGGGVIDLGDTIVSQRSYEVAALAAGALIDAVTLVASEKAKNAFALVRPPGHHAGAYYALGFCLFNNIAIGASHLLKRLDFDRVLIIDIDAHHGNGTQEIFYGTDRVLYVSLHEDPSGFPGTGFMDEVGEGEGLGYTVNVPLPFRTDNTTYQRAFDEIVMPIASQYRPEFVLVSAGFDGHYSDAIGDLALSTKSYEETFSKIVTLADHSCKGRLVASLEGGYSLNVLGKLATSAIAKMARAFYALDDSRPSSNLRTLKKAEQIINSVKNIQSSYWKL